MFWDKISNDRHFLKFDLSESCKSLDNSQLYRFCYISILHNLFYHIDGFQSEKSQNPYGAFFLGHPVPIGDWPLITSEKEPNGDNDSDSGGEVYPDRFPV